MTTTSKLGNKQLRLIAVVILSQIAGISCRIFSDNPHQLKDPTRSYQMKITLDEGGSILYTLQTVDGDTLIFPSKIGFELDTGMLNDGFKLSSVSKLSSGQITYQPVFSQGVGYVEPYSERTWTYHHPSGVILDLQARMMEDGLAYRAGLTNPQKDDIHIVRELTHFGVPCSSRAWIAPYDEVTKWTPGYELPYTESYACEPAPRLEGWAFPALFETQSHFLLITEAHLDGTYPGCHLELDAASGQYNIRFPEITEAMGMWNSYPESAPSIWTPWRVISVAKSAEALTEIKMVDALNPDPAESDWSWVLPGRASWSWWSDHDSSQDPEKLKAFIDFSVTMGWEYSLIDANWNVIDSTSLRSLLSYAEDRGVGVWMWYNSGGPHNEVEEAPRDKMHVTSSRRKEFAKLNEWGVKGVKIDFFQSDKVPVIKQYIEILEDAAEYKLMVNFHGCTLPRGWSKTYPHLLTMEAVRGAEAYSFNEAFPSIAPQHHCILPFTRNLLGPMDYTPVTFSNQKYPRQTSDLHELALGILFESFVQHLADSPSSYLSQPKPILELLKQIPTHWEESKCIHANIGKSVVMARRYQNTWYVAGINGEPESKTIVLDLDFLLDSGKSIRLLEENTEGDLLINEHVLEAQKGISVFLKGHGGFVGQTIR